MRGKACFFKSFNSSVGITPAYAGKSTWKCMPFATSQDHPRLCGEKRNHFTGDCINGGSPPPMRGKEAFSGRIRKAG